jgi:hypothetical protein
MLKSCRCPFCTEPERPIYAHTDESLWWLVQTRDDIHDKRKRVYAYIHLFYRAGIFDPMMPYRVWINVIGTEEDPPFACKGSARGGADDGPRSQGIGAFQTERFSNGETGDGQWWWWDVVGRDTQQWPN